MRFLWSICDGFYPEDTLSNACWEIDSYFSLPSWGANIDQYDLVKLMLSHYIWEMRMLNDTFHAACVYVCLLFKLWLQHKRNKKDWI